MKLTFDPRRNIAYIRLRERGTEIETIRVSDELSVDLAPDGSVYGIELTNANEQLGASDGGRFVVVRNGPNAKPGKLPRLLDGTWPGKARAIAAPVTAHRRVGASTKISKRKAQARGR